MTQRRHRHDGDSVGVKRFRYESLTGRYWVEVDAIPAEDGLVDYDSNTGVGRVHPSTFSRMLANGWFQPDDNKTPMKEVSPV